MSNIRRKLTDVSLYCYHCHCYHSLGAFPFFFIDRPGKTIKGVCNALACGVMVGAAFDLIHEGQQYDGFITVVGLLLGVAFVYFTQQKFAEGCAWISAPLVS